MYLLKGNIKQSKNLPMVSKKLKLLLALVGLMQTASYAQSTDANWAYDSTKTSSKAQYNEFTNYQTPYPAKPRGMWELSVSGGNAVVLGDRPFTPFGETSQPRYTGGYAGGISARFAFSHVFSGRIGWLGSIQKIPGYKGYIPYTSNVTHSINMDLIASLNTISSYRGNPKVNYYVFVGYGLTASQISQGNPDDGGFSATGPVRFDLYQQEANNLIKTFHEDDNGNKNQALYHTIGFGAGIDFRISQRIKLGVEERIVTPLTGLDMLDGYVNATSNGVKGSRDKFAFSTAKISFDLGNASTHTEPLWWVNPNNYLYNEVATPKHMKLPPVVLPDADGDGVTDQFDMEPNTPAGCAVDVKGVSLDTDGDGVPDCRDKEKLTPANCFPVNADGVGTCPEPECCKAIDSLRMTSNCGLGSLPSIQFKSGSATLSETARSLLTNVAQQLSANPACKVKLVGYGASDKRAQQLSWDHVNAIKTFLTEQQGISESRIIWSSGVEGNNTTVDLVPTTEEGPNTVPAPHPNLSKGK
jgi:OOP family OmpA-OmpF porin